MDHFSDLTSAQPNEILKIVSIKHSFDYVMCKVLKQRDIPLLQHLPPIVSGVNML